MSNLERALRNCLTVREVIEQLQDLPPDAKVLFSYNYGDHWNSQVADTVKEIDTKVVEYSDYHRMPKVDMDHTYIEDIEEEGGIDEAETEEEKAKIKEEVAKNHREVVILSSGRY